MERKANIDEWSLGAIQRKVPQDVLVFLEVEIALLETSEDMRTFVVERKDCEDRGSPTCPESFWIEGRCQGPVALKV